jgi:DNA repair exonuclease SbcCD ATPase subunit
MGDASVELAKREEERRRAASRVSGIESEWRQAIAASRDASAALAEVERHGRSAAARSAAEQKLTDARAKADEPWAERVEGARSAARDVDRAYRAHVTAHLGELVEELEERGRDAVVRVNDAAGELAAAITEREAVAEQIRSLISKIARPGVADVRYGAGDELAQAVAAFIRQGGEIPPTLDRNRPPWDTLLGGDVAGVELDVPEPAVA